MCIKSNHLCGVISVAQPITEIQIFKIKKHNYVLIKKQSSIDWKSWKDS